MAKILFSGLGTLCRFAGCPTSTPRLSVNATIEGVVRAPSAFSITFGALPSITATQELVVPRSIPIALAMVQLLMCGCRDVWRLPRSGEESWDGLLGGGRRARSTSLKVTARGDYAASLTSIFFGSALAGLGIV